MRDELYVVLQLLLVGRALIRRNLSKVVVQDLAWRGMSL